MTTTSELHAIVELIELGDAASYMGESEMSTHLA